MTAILNPTHLCGCGEPVSTRGHLCSECQPAPIRRMRRAVAAMVDAVELHCPSAEAEEAAAYDADRRVGEERDAENEIDRAEYLIGEER